MHTYFAKKRIDYCLKVIALFFNKSLKFPDRVSGGCERFDLKANNFAIIYDICKKNAKIFKFEFAK